jgi:glycosyltransferase involved in cell wall biosynthesis
MEAAHRLGRPAICKVANGGPGFDLPRIDSTSTLGSVWRKRLVRDLDRWIAISEEIRTDLTAAGVPSERIADIPNGIDPAQLPSRAPSSQITNFLYLGRLYKCDVETLIRAFAQHLGKHPDSRLRITGGGDPEPARRLLEKHANVADQIELPGVSPPNTELQWAHAIVHPTRSEGVSNTLLEALCMGLPCIASDIPPNREVLKGGDAGLLYPPSDIAALTDCLEELARNPSLTAAMRAGGHKRIDEHYHIDRVTNRYLALYEELGIRRRAEVNSQ